MSELDYSDDDGSSIETTGMSCIHKNIMEFIRTLEMRQFQMISRHQQFNIDSDMHVKQDWAKIENSLSEMLEDGSTECLGVYTFLLSLHINYKIKLLRLELDALFFCIEPGLIIELFDKSLVSSNCAHLLKRIDSNCLFIGLESMDEYPYAYEILMSLSLLLYKLQCKSKRKAIMKSVKENLSEFILHESYDDSVKKIAIRKLLESIVLNGITSLNQFNEFLMKTCIVSSDDDDDDSDDNRMNVDNHRQTVTVGEKILMKNTNLFHDMFPLSLKNLCRIFIKNNMLAYNPYAVSVLDIPVVMRKFLLFEDEISDILKQVERQAV